MVRNDEFVEGGRLTVSLTAMARCHGDGGPAKVILPNEAGVQASIAAAGLLVLSIRTTVQCDSQRAPPLWLAFRAVLALAMLAAPACAQVTVEGDCVLINGGFCVTTPGYPGSYGINHNCTISDVPSVPLQVVHFDVQKGSSYTYSDDNNIWCHFDYMTVSATRYCGGRTPDGVVADGGIIN
jgi:hypothetical protein